jgi:transcriptional regulator with XRE-family HTH domain
MAEMGRRLVDARGIAGLDQGTAARLLGYTCGVHLSEAENGRRFLTLPKLRSAAELYGVTLDYLFGLNEHPLRDPVSSVQEAVAKRISADVHHLARTLVGETANPVRTYLPGGAMAQRLAGVVLEADAALQRLRERCPAFDSEIPASALVSKLSLAASLAGDYATAVRQAREAQAVRDRRAELHALNTPLTLPAVPDGT